MRAAVASVLGVMLIASITGQELRRPNALEPIGAIVDAFQDHQIVALSEGTAHADETGHAFRLALLQDARFVATVNDIVVEWGNARYQPLLDRYVNGDDDVTARDLARVRSDTTQPTTVWDRHMYGDFFAAVRAVNLTRPAPQRLRVLVADPPADWDTMRPEDIFTMERDRHAVDVIKREVLDRGRRVLLVFGGGHLQRRNIISNYDMTAPASATIVSLLESTLGARVFSILGSTLPATLEPDAGQWPHPSLLMLAGTTLGAHDFAEFFPQPVRLRFVNGAPSRIPDAEFRPLPIAEQFDAIWYPGPTVTLEPIPKELCGDTEYMTMRLHRLAALPTPPPGRPTLADTLRTYCRETP